MRKLYFVVCISLLTPAGAIIIPAFPVSVSDNLLSAAKLTVNSPELHSTGGRPSGGDGDEVFNQVFQLSHESANNMIPVLRPLVSPNNTITAFPGNNTLIITDYAANLKRLSKVIATLDSPRPAAEVQVLGKGGKRRTVPVGRAALAALDVDWPSVGVDDAGGVVGGVVRPSNHPFREPRCVVWSHV